MTTLRECLDNLRDFNISELKSVQSRCSYLIGTKHREETRQQEIDRLIAEHQESQGREHGAEWVQPTSAMDAYPVGAVVTHEGQQWRSTTPANVWSPGQSGWRQLSEDGAPPPYVQPSSAADAYEEGEEITWTDGNVYRAVRSGVVHSPDEYPDDWRLVEEEPDPEPEPEPEEPADPEEPEPGDGEGDENDEPTDPEPEPEPGTIDNPHTWEADVDYEADHYVAYNEALYRVLQDHTSAAHWTPDAVPALYQQET